MCERDQRERERETREKQESEDRNKESPLEGCVRLQFDWREWIKRTQTISNQQRTSQQHDMHFDSGHSKGRDEAPPNLPGGCTCGVPASPRGAKPRRRELELEQHCLPWQCIPASRSRTFSSGSASHPEVTVKQDMLCMHSVSIKAMLPRRLPSVMHSVNLLTISDQAQPFITTIMHA